MAAYRMRHKIKPPVYAVSPSVRPYITHQELDSLSGTVEQAVHELVELVQQHDPSRADESSSGFVETDGDSEATECEWSARRTM